MMEAFTNSAIIALHEMVQVEAFQSQPAEAGFAGPTLSARIRLLRQPPGILSMLLSLETARQLTERYLPAGADVNDELIDDTMGEFVNVIAGQAKTILKSTAYHYTITTPEVIRSDDPTQLFLPAKFPDPVRIAELVCELGSIRLEVVLPEQHDK
jgi:CheY-specific phosphatase CheX